ncbi:MAG: hypothetical protein PHI38_00825 [Sulfurimonas sp.]|uniref:hypothetical protein n=1 Tax=Sulfurimonas sp. TaxID=2022749 RepID=UPI00262FBFDA|nr:hypothetical protein [Sulfurimonas sp.]MDD3475389.1 hypothetical protein [Sulfurimonas sp.]
MYQEPIDNNQIIEQIEPTPRLYLKKCRVIALILKLFLQYATVLLSVVVWYFYDFFIALLALVLTFIIMGIIRSKLRNSSIPFTQREHHYDDAAIATWYTAKTLCDREL